MADEMRNGAWSDERIANAPFPDIVGLMLELFARAMRHGPGPLRDEFHRIHGAVLRRATPPAPRVTEAMVEDALRDSLLLYRDGPVLFVGLKGDSEFSAERMRAVAEHLTAALRGTEG